MSNTNPATIVPTSSTESVVPDEEIRRTGYSHVEGTEICESVLTSCLDGNDAPIVFMYTQPSLTIPTATKRRRGRPKSDNPLTNADRKRRWRERHGEDARVKAREYMREYRKL